MSAISTDRRWRFDQCRSEVRWTRRFPPAKSQLRTRSRFKRPPLFVEAGEDGSGRYRQAQLAEGRAACAPEGFQRVLHFAALTRNGVRSRPERGRVRMHGLEQEERMKIEGDVCAARFAIPARPSRSLSAYAIVRTARRAQERPSTPSLQCRRQGSPQTERCRLMRAAATVARRPTGASARNVAHPLRSRPS